MSVSMFGYGLFGRLRQAAGQDWQHYVSHPFLQQLGSGALPQIAFRRYLTQDYLFLIHFARAYALLATKFHTLPEIRAAVRSLNHIVAELPLHVGYCTGWGLNEIQMAREPEASETLNYTRYVLDIGHSGDALELLAALLPCVAGYAEAGLLLLNDPHTLIEGNPYASWIQNYSDPEYLAGVNGAIEMLEQVGLSRGAEGRFTRLSEIFTTATRLESAFWQMGLNAADGSVYRK
ncbi:TenA family protein [Citrobacter sp. JGM124]|uniref:TenA family protein n=1 Tax=Citrobacter sp. JGM124 TaxID=2799789 RepID=UPI001BAB08AF|nr:TenA family protein [Citrobacter sp. JGM124]MBS0848855.1 TenA family protein [Citrobacter sp. JGM124]